MAKLKLTEQQQAAVENRGGKLLVFTSFWAIDFTCRRNPGLQVKEIVVSEG